MAKAPFVPMHPGWWPDIADQIDGEWSESAVMMDLRWWADQMQRRRENSLGHPIKRPGRYALVKRWGGGMWTHHKVAAMLKAETVWGDPYKAESQRGAKASEQHHKASEQHHKASETEPEVVDNTDTTVKEASEQHHKASEHRPTRVLSQPSTDPPSTVHPPQGPPAAAECEEQGKQQQREPPHRPNFGEPPSREPPAPLPPPSQLADRVTFVESWNAYAHEFYPGQPSQRWEATTLAAKRGHRNSGLFISPKDSAKEQAMLEFGDHLLPMLDRYAECCRGDHGDAAVRSFERRDFEGSRMLAAMHLWVTAGKPPHWVGTNQKTETPAAKAEATGLDNSFLLGQS